MHHGKVSEEIAKGLLELQKRIKLAKIPSTKVDETLNIATWNIREFGKKRRTEAAIHYIAEILGQFDLIGIVELRDNLTEKGTNYSTKLTWWRSPYLASFRAGNFDFVVLTVHIKWGKSNSDRLEELQLLAEWIDAKKNEKYNEDKDMIIMGDFNIPSRQSKLFKAVSSKGLSIPRSLTKLNFGSNLEKNKRYDQILLYPNYPDNFTNKGGILDFYMNDVKPLFPKMNKHDFTFQLSDHLPLWMQIKTDIDGFLLEQLIQNQ